MNSDDSKKVLTADFRNVGANDLIVLLDQAPYARYYKNINGANGEYFEENSTVKQHLENAIGAPPSDGKVCDIDDDGDLDLILAVGSEIKILLNQYKYDSSERFTLVPFAEALSTQNGNLYKISGNGAAIQKVVVSDVDGDYDLDLVILKTIAGDGRGFVV